MSVDSDAGITATSVVEYMLRSLSLFSTTIIIVIVIVVAVTSVRTWDLGSTRFARPVTGVAATGMSAIPALRRLASADAAERSRAAQVLMIGAGAVLTVAALGMAWMARHVQVSTYGFLLLLGIGPLLLTWPTRADHRGRFPYARGDLLSAARRLEPGAERDLRLRRNRPDQDRAAGSGTRQLSSCPVVVGPQSRSVRGSPKRYITALSNRVIALIRSPASVVTTKPEACPTPVSGSRR